MVNTNNKIQLEIEVFGMRIYYTNRMKLPCGWEKSVQWESEHELGWIGQLDILCGTHLVSGPEEVKQIKGMKYNLNLSGLENHQSAWFNFEEPRWLFDASFHLMLAYFTHMYCTQSNQLLIPSSSPLKASTKE